MEPPSKRLKLGRAPYDNNDNDDDDDEENLDELSMSPTQFDIRQDPLYRLDKGRAKAATRLKSAFENIFEKYGRDFTGVGDEIDLETGEVIINNGHLQSLQDDKDRSREGSISSAEEERIMRGKDVEPPQDSNSKSLVRSNSSTHTPPQGLHTGFGQHVTTGGPNQHLLSLGVPPNPFMFGPSFGPPLFVNRAMDPLWQTPEIPVPFYQDRFGFMGQAMGYPQPLGYGHWPVPIPGGGYGYGPPSGLPRLQAPRKLPNMKTPGRKLLPSVAPAGNDSEEDDILLGNSTRVVIELPAIEGDSEPSSSTEAPKKEKQVDREDAKKNAMLMAEQYPPKLRRGPGRPRKAAIPEKTPETNDERAQECDGNTVSTLNAHFSKPTTELTSPLTTTISPSQPSLEEGPVLPKRIEVRLDQTLTPGNTDTPDVQQRRSSRTRKQTEFYGKTLWLKKSRSRPEIIKASIMTANPINEPADPSHPEVNGIAGRVDPSDSPRDEGEIVQPESIERSADDDEPAKEPQSDIQSQEPRDEEPSLVNQVDYHQDKILDDRLIITSLHTSYASGDVTTPALPTENLREPDSLLPNSENNIKDMDNLLRDNETPAREEPEPSANSSNEGELLQNSDQKAYPDQVDSELTSPKSDDLVEDENIVAAPEVAAHDPMDNEAPEALEEVHELNTTASNDHEEFLNAPTQIQSEEIGPHSPEISQGEKPPSISNAMEMESRPDTVASVPGFVMEVPEDSPQNVIAQPPGKPARPLWSKKQASAEKSKLPLRQSQTQNGPSSPPSSKDGQIKNVKSSGSSKGLPFLPAKPSTNSPVPKTPKKRRGSHINEYISSGNRTPSTKTKFALTSLIPDDPDDEDELSLLSSSVPPSPFQPGVPSSASTPHKTGNRQHSLLPSSSHRGSSTPHRISKHHIAPATDFRARGSKRKFGFGSGGVQSSPLARTVVNRDSHDNLALTATPSRRRNRAAASPTGSPVRTPGGTVRRCGEDGFVCDRDFCFTCCR
ncbi:hypothetical protein AAE478_009287 [Parahypoxylon ruwenzoriense]